MTRRLVAAAASCLVLLAGLWLILAPFALGIQPTDGDWVDQTYTDVWSGIGLAVVGLIATAAFIVALVRHLAERGLISPRPARPEPVAVPTADAPSSDLDALLAPLVAALAHDLERDRERDLGLDPARATNNHRPQPTTPPDSADAGHPATSEQSKETPR